MTETSPLAAVQESSETSTGTGVPRPSMAEQARIAEILAGPRGAQIGAFFDFDSTVVAGYSVTEFLNARLRRLAAEPARLRQLVSTVGVAGFLRPASVAGRNTNNDELRAVYELALSAWAGRSEEELDSMGARAMAERLNCQVWRLIQAHHHMGHTVALVSSAPRCQLAALARELEVEHLLCTELEIKDGTFTGRLAGDPLLRGADKAEAAAAFATAHTIDLSRSHGYAGTRDDLAFLRTVARPCVISPNGATTRAAATARWPVLPLDRRPPRPSTVARSLLAWGSLAPMLTTGAGVNVAAGRGARVSGLELALASRTYMRIAGVRLRVEGEEHLWSRRPAVFIINHQSPLDVTIAIQLAEHGVTFVAKDSIQRVPGLTRVTDLVYVDRSSTRAALRMFTDAVDRLRRGTSVIIAPEGTRSLTPSPGTFKKGAFLIAKRAGVPVVPIIIHNSAQLMPRSAMTTAAGEVRVTVAPPIDVSGWKVSELDQRITAVRDLYLATLTGYR
ncbi:HAD-IB family hydrolase [Actinomadura fulvescens]|uniref:HAD-IB family hydrolase n=1 Tax=Actinomadura fulvescens TaxID=46160 RepID=A0ABP6D7H1_9ACTN